tara:strand:- start:49 stop:510 length:462 start_codon:yes stop_codon:yes gene_type:complete
MFINSRKIKPSKAKIANRIKEITEILSADDVSWFDVKRSHNDADRMRELFKVLSENGEWTEEEKLEMKTLDTTLANLDEEYKRLSETMTADLMEVRTKYVATDVDRLISPAGFHPTEPVFLQTRVAIHVDDPRDLPKTFGELYIHNVDELTRR